MLGAISLPTVVGIGSQDPESVSLVRGADVARSQHIPRRIIPERGQLTEHDAESANSEVWAILHERVSGSNFANDASELRPETAALAGDPGAFARARDVLAGEPARDDVDMPAPGPAIEGADVIPDGKGREESVPLSGE